MSEKNKFTEEAKKKLLSPELKEAVPPPLLTLDPLFNIQLFEAKFVRYERSFFLDLPLLMLRGRKLLELLKGSEYEEEAKRYIGLGEEMYKRIQNIHYAREKLKKMKHDYNATTVFKVDEEEE